jgi:serine/threonine protein kinase
LSGLGVKRFQETPIRFGKHLLLDRISIGGMAEVWRAVETDAARRVVAIKRLLPTVAEHPELVSMFIAEARVMLALDHPNIVRVYELGEVARTHFMSMEYVHGRDLRRILELCRESRLPAPIPIACYVISQVCQALDHVHRLLDESGRQINLVHRDVSPSNVLVSYRGDVKLIDFGIAQAGARGAQESGEVDGKAAYMSPEQVLGRSIDRRSDIFSVGVCLHELLTGKRLFAGTRNHALAAGVRFQIPLPSRRNPSIQPALDSIVLKALASDPENRYQCASELAEDLRRFLAQSCHFEAKDLVKYMEST